MAFECHGEYRRTDRTVDRQKAAAIKTLPYSMQIAHAKGLDGLALALPHQHSDPREHPPPRPARAPLTRWFHTLLRCVQSPPAFCLQNGLGGGRRDGGARKVAGVRINDAQRQMFLAGCVRKELFESFDQTPRKNHPVCLTAEQQHREAMR